MTHKKFILNIFFLLVIILSLNCKQNSKEIPNKLKVTCFNGNWFEPLLKEILKQDDIYCTIDSVSYTYLISDNFIKPGVIYSHSSQYETYKITSIDKDSIKDKYANSIAFTNYEINNDTSTIKIEVAFFAKYKKSSNKILDVNTKVSYVTFNLDSLHCKWILKDFKSEFMH